MAEQLLKLTVNEVNDLLDSEYNMISFDSLSRNDLLQIFFNCLHKMNTHPKVDVQNNVDEALGKLIKLLTDIKAPLAIGVEIDDFTNGFIHGKRKLLMATLFWIVTNREEVKKRAYLSKYLTKVELNDAIIGEPDVQSLLHQYEDLLQHFKRVYTQSSKFYKIANATTQLRNTIEKQNKDMANITDLLSKQTAKMDNIPNKEALLISVRGMRTEMLTDKQLSEQISTQTETVSELKRKLRDYKLSSGENPRDGRDSGRDVMSRLRDEVRAARALRSTTGGIKSDEEDLRERLRVSETVTRTHDDQIDERQLREHLERVRRELSVETQRPIDEPTASNDERLVQYRRHASQVTNGRRVAANRLAELRNDIETAKQQLVERERRMREAVGAVGTRLPYGDDLRQFVGGLRGQGAAYKEARARLLELQAESGVLARTRDLLLQIEPQLSEHENVEPMSTQEGTTAESRRACARLVADVRRLRVQVTQLTTDVRERSNNLQRLEDTHQQQKQIFDSSLEEYDSKVRELQEEINRIETGITTKENRWKQIQNAIEENENLLEKLLQESESSPTTVDDLNIKLATEEKRRAQLQDEMNTGKKDKVECEEQTAAWHSTLSLLKFKSGRR